MSRYFNYDQVKFTPAGGGGAVTLNGVTGVRYNSNGTTKEFRGDNDHFPTTRVADFQNPSFQVTLANLKQLIQTLTHGAKGIFEYRMLHANNGAGTDAITVATATGTAMVDAPSANSQHGQYGTGDVTIRTTSADGLTNPCTFTVAT